MFRNVQTATKIRLAAAVGLVATAGIVAAIARFGAGSFSDEVLVALLILGVLAVAATNLEVMARTNTGISGNVMVLVASIIVFCHYSYFLGPALVGLLCGFFDFAHLRNREWMKISFNCASEALAMLGGTGAFLLATSFRLDGTTRVPEPRCWSAHPPPTSG